MKKLLLAMMLVPALAWAQAYPPDSSGGGGGYDGGVVTNPFLAPVGCVNPGLSFDGYGTTAGICQGQASPLPPALQMFVVDAATDTTITLSMDPSDDLGVVGPFTLRLEETNTGAFTEMYFETDGEQWNLDSHDASGTETAFFEIRGDSKQFKMTAADTDTQDTGTLTHKDISFQADYIDNSNYRSTFNISASGNTSEVSLILDDGVGFSDIDWNVDLDPALARTGPNVEWHLASLAGGAADYVMRPGEYVFTDPLVYRAAKGDTNEIRLAYTAPTAARTITLPDKSGTVAMTSDIGGGGTKVVLAADDTSVVATPGENLALGFTPANSTTYAITGRYYHNTTASSTGEIVGVDWPTSDTLVGTCTFFGANSLTATKIMAQVAASGTATSTFYTSTPGLNQPRVTTIECAFTTGTNTSGDFTLRTGVETVTGSPTTTVYAGTWFEYEALP